MRTVARLKGNVASRGREPVASRADVLRAFVRRHADEILRDGNLTSLGVISRGGQLQLQFTVARKFSRRALARENTVLIPKHVQVAGVSVATDVVEATYRPSVRLVEHQRKGVRKVRADPLVAGVSVGHSEGRAGTLGLIVFDRDGLPCILSNWHVLHAAQGRIGDLVLQPGPFDDNRGAVNAAARLVRSHVSQSGDFAIARVEGREVALEIMGLGVAASALGVPEEGDVVVKSGRTTGVTYGVVHRVDAVVQIDYGIAGVHNVGGFEIRPMDEVSGAPVAEPGDSGAAWMMTTAEHGAPRATGVLLGIGVAIEASSRVRRGNAFACYAVAACQKLEVSLQKPQ